MIRTIAKTEEMNQKIREQIDIIRAPNTGKSAGDRWNNLHPDPLHQAWLEKEGYIVREDGSLWKYSGRGVRLGEKRRCGKCGETGHYAKACPNVVTEEPRMGRQKGQKVRCSNCRGKGHYASTCPNTV